MADAHALTRIPAYRLGLLEPDDALSVRGHLRDCAPCRDAFEPFRELTDDEERRPGHLPIALLTRWDTFAPMMTADERTCLEDHVDACKACAESRAFARHVRELPEARPARPRRAWLGFGTAAMAAVLAVVFALRERPSPSPVVAVKSAPAPAPASLVVRAPAVSLAGVDRGEGPMVVDVPAGSTLLPIRVPPLLGVGPDARIRIRVEGPGGADFGRTELEHRQLFGTAAAPAIEARAPDGPLPAGHYRVTVAGGGESATYGFELRQR